MGTAWGGGWEEEGGGGCWAGRGGGHPLGILGSWGQPLRTLGHSVVGVRGGGHAPGTGGHPEGRGGTHWRWRGTHREGGAPSGDGPRAPTEAAGRQGVPSELGELQGGEPREVWDPPVGGWVSGWVLGAATHLEGAQALLQVGQHGPDLERLVEAVLDGLRGVEVLGPPGWQRCGLLQGQPPPGESPLSPGSPPHRHPSYGPTCHFRRPRRLSGDAGVT